MEVSMFCGMVTPIFDLACQGCAIEVNTERAHEYTDEHLFSHEIRMQNIRHGYGPVRFHRENWLSPRDSFGIDDRPVRCADEIATRGSLSVRISEEPDISPIEKGSDED
jgi:hypothetical protein